MSKLELKHLAPYLPYGLKCHCMGLCKDDYAEPRIPVIAQIIGLGDYVTIHGIGRSVTEEYVYSDVFPILRPLSDLVKPCLPDERTPAEEMEDDLMMSWCVAYDEAYEVITENEATLRAKVKMLPYEMVEWLFEHHFDVYGLIEQELAVDINALQT